MSQSKRLFELTQAYLDDLATPEMVQELSDLLLADESARHQFALIMSLSRRLYNLYRVEDILQIAADSEAASALPPSDSQLRVAMADLLAAEEAAEAEIVPIHEREAHPDDRRSVTLPFRDTTDTDRGAGRPAPRVIVIPRALVYAVSFAAAVALALLVWAFIPEARDSGPTQPLAEQPVQTTTPRPAFFATVVDVAHLRGGAGGSGYAIGDRLEGDLVLGEEVLEVRLSTGVHAVITGPFRGRLLDAERMFLDHGEVVIDVTESDRGYIVSTATGEYRDLGTVFAVSQRERGVSEVFVLRGEVLATRQGAAGPAQQQSLHAGQAARVVTGGQDIEVYERFDRRFSRSARDARRAYRQAEIERQTIAYWDFEPRYTATDALPYSLLEPPIQPAVMDASGRSNHLYLFDGDDMPYIVTGQVPAGVVGWDARPNRQSVYFPASRIVIDNTNDLFNWPSESDAPAGYQLAEPDWGQWTIELSFKPDRLDGKQTVLGMDGEIRMGDTALPVFACTLNEGQLVVSCIDSSSELREIACPLSIPIRESQWVNLALIYDGDMLKLLVKSPDTTGYQFCGQVPLVGGLKVPGLRPDKNPQIWTVGRGMENGRYSNMFNGYIDEVRFCRLALQTEELLHSKRANSD